MRPRNTYAASQLLYRPTFPGESLQSRSVGSEVGCRELKRRQGCWRAYLSCFQRMLFTDSQPPTPARNNVWQRPGTVPNRLGDGSSKLCCSRDCDLDCSIFHRVTSTRTDPGKLERLCASRRQIPVNRGALHAPALPASLQRPVLGQTCASLQLILAPCTALGWSRPGTGCGPGSCHPRTDCPAN